MLGLQDTNSLQYEMMKLLKGTGAHLFVVGDPNQAIFSWKGADNGCDRKFEDDFGASISSHSLIKNHRWEAGFFCMSHLMPALTFLANSTGS